MFPFAGKWLGWLRAVSLDFGNFLSYSFVVETPAVDGVLVYAFIKGGDDLEILGLVRADLFGFLVPCFGLGGEDVLF